MFPLFFNIRQATLTAIYSEDDKKQNTESTEIKQNLYVQKILNKIKYKPAIDFYKITQIWVSFFSVANFRTTF